MKILKLIFSRISLICIAIAIEFAFIILSLIYWQDAYSWLKTITSCLGVIMFFNLINRQQIPEMKIPWLVCFMTFPLFGVTLYILISNNKPTRKQLKIINKTLAKQPINRERAIYSTNENSHLLGIEEYLHTTTKSYGYSNCDIHFLSGGEMFLQDLLSNLRIATNFIFMEYFIIQKGIMWDSIYEILTEKVKQGVEVFILYDDIGTAGKLPASFARKLRKVGIKCRKFNPFIPLISGIHNNRDHRKITVIDGKIGYVGGINLADEYINKKSPYGHWKDSAVRIEGQAVKDLTYMFLQMYDVSQNRLSDYDKYINNIEYPKFENSGLVHCFETGPHTKDNIALNNFINMISSATESIYVTTPYLIIDNSLTTALIAASQKGVDVNIIVPHIPDKKIIFGITKSSYKNLLKYGIKVYEYTPGFIHSKQVLIDNKIAFVGSINFDYRSLIHHFECGVITTDSTFINEINVDFKNTINVSELKDLNNVKINKFTQLINTFLAIFRPLF